MVYMLHMVSVVYNVIKSLDIVSSFLASLFFFFYSTDALLEGKPADTVGIGFDFVAMGELVYVVGVVS